MPTVQDTWNDAPPNGFPGMVASGERDNVISRNVEDAAGLAYGKFAWRGTGDRGCVIAATAGTLLGVCIVDHGMAVLPGGVSADIVPQGRSAALMTKGAVYVTVGEDVTDGAQVYVTPTGGTIVDTVGSNIIAPGWFFDDTVANGGICRIVNRG